MNWRLVAAVWIGAAANCGQIAMNAASQSAALAIAALSPPDPPRAQRPSAWVAKCRPSDDSRSNAWR